MRDFLPCICKHTPGLIDRVSGRFFTSTNGFPASCCRPVTNGFAVGTRPDFRLEYVASDGSADTYVDTGVRGQNTVGMETEMMWETVPSDGSYLASRLGNDTRVYLYHHYGSRCYSLRLWKDGQLVRDFVPVSYAGIPMLWDEIGEKLYPSSGAKHLVAGPVTGKYMRGAMLIVR